MTLPRDVHPAAHRQQMDLILAMTPTQRFQLGMRWIEMGRKIMITRIKAETPDLSPSQLVVAIFERCHGHLFSAEMKARITASILAAHGEE